MIKKTHLQFHNVAIGIIWLFHLCGILGILYGDSQWFVGATPLNLSLCFVLLMLSSRHAPKVYLVALIAFIVGMVACLLYTSPSPRDGLLSRMPSSA